MDEPAGPAVSDPGAYVVRSTRRALDGRVHYEIVDMAGRVSYVTLPYALTTSEWADPVIRAHVQAQAFRMARR